MRGATARREDTVFDYLHSASQAPPIHILIRPHWFIRKAARRNEEAHGQVE